jgi:hypothetical protein
MHRSVLDGVRKERLLASFMNQLSVSNLPVQFSTRIETLAAWDLLACELSEEWCGVESDCANVSLERGQLNPHAIPRFGDT